MYNVNDTIVAVSSPAKETRVIVRVTGPEAFRACEEIFVPNTASDIHDRKKKIAAGNLKIDDELEVPAFLYRFPSPHSYTGDDVAEMHIFTNPSITDTILEKLLNLGLRPAEPGEFTARAYLNGKMDLAQAEAVNEIIVSSNELQLLAAENLLAGRLSQTTEEIRTSIMNCMSRLEAGLDFSGEDIEFISQKEAIEKLKEIKNRLEELLAGSIRYETLMDLPSVGITGAPNAGKSTLVNKLLGSERSIVSHKRKTTRDVLTGLLKLEHSDCVLFDCAGLISEPENILDELAQQRATEALRNSAVTIFCVDISKTDWTEDCEIRELIDSRNVLPVASKCDLILEKDLVPMLEKLNQFFGTKFFPISAKTGQGIKSLLKNVDSFFSSKKAISEMPLALVSRHKKAVTESITNVNEAIDELKSGNDEVCTMMLRAAYKEISQIKQQNIDDLILDQIFSRFCIGK